MDRDAIAGFLVLLIAILSFFFVVFYPSASEARTFGCFVGVLGASNEHSTEIDYNHYQIFYNKKSTSEFLPFLGCGVSFDF
jgi:hypothetical protein